MFDSELVYSILKKILATVDRIIKNSSNINSVDYYTLSSSGMERLESTCMLLIAIGESIKGVDKITDKQFLPNYPEIDWKGVMGMRDIIAHHYFDIDAELIYEVVKEELPKLKNTLEQMLKDIV